MVLNYKTMEKEIKETLFYLKMVLVIKENG
jgi:hypothetical protein